MSSSLKLLGKNFTQKSNFTLNYSFLISSKSNTGTNEDETKQNSSSKHIHSHQLSTSPSKRTKRCQESTDTQSKKKVSIERKSISKYSLQSQINSIRMNKKIAQNFYRKINFKSDFYGLNAYCPGMSDNLLKELFETKKQKIIEVDQQSPLRIQQVVISPIEVKKSKKMMEKHVLLKAIEKSIGITSRNSQMNHYSKTTTLPQGQSKGNFTQRAKRQQMNSIYKSSANNRSPAASLKLFSKTRRNISRNYPENIMKTATKTISIKTQSNFWSGNHAQSGSIEPEEVENTQKKFRKTTNFKKQTISTSVNKLPKRNLHSPQSLQSSHFH
jgi:hypothetical protein